MLSSLSKYTVSWFKYKIKSALIKMLTIATPLRPHSSAADHSVPGAGVQALSEWAEPGPTSSRQPQEPHPEAAGTESSCPFKVGSGCSWKRVNVLLCCFYF